MGLITRTEMGFTGTFSFFFSGEFSVEDFFPRKTMGGNGVG
jgi:hypothetical protein